MTLQGMRKDNYSYYLIPGNCFPVPVELAYAKNLAASANDAHYDEQAMKISDRIQSDSKLESQVRAFWMTKPGLLIHGTEDAAYTLSHATEFKQPETVADNVVRIGRTIADKFDRSVHHFTGRALDGIGHIATSFGGIAAGVQAANAPVYSGPELRLAA